MNLAAGRPGLRLLHTSDIHVSTPRSLGVMAAVVDAAIAAGVDVVAIAGDLFDSSRVPPDVAEQTVSELARLSVPTFVVPGNHDCIDDRSIHHRVDITRAGDHVFFVRDPDGRRVVLEDLGLTVWARGIESHHPDNRPLTGYQPGDPAYWEVVVTHGHYVRRDEASDRSSQINQDEIGRLRCDYLALGHWHRFLDVSEGPTRAFYSGSPSEPGSDGATVNLVTLDPEAGVQVERRPIDVDGSSRPIGG